MGMPDLHRELPEQREEGTFDERALALLERIADALEAQNEIASRIRGGLQKLKEGPSEDSKPSTAPKPPPQDAKPAVRAYENYREAGWDDNDNSLWEVKIEGQWVPANPLEAKLFNKRLTARKNTN
jgi:hypothetical protein